MIFQRHLHAYTLDSIRYSLTNLMPEGERQRFYLWGISPENPDQNGFLQTIGVNQIINLSHHLLANLVETDYMEEVAQYCGALNSYFMYEIVSDDMAIGLMTLRNNGEANRERKEVLQHFNQAMVERLSGNGATSAELMSPIENSVREISTFRQSLSQPRLMHYLDLYMEDRPQAFRHDIEYAAWPMLLTNIDVCGQAVDRMNPFAVSTLVRGGLIDHYTAVSRTLSTNMTMLPDELLNVGTQTVSVIPVLAYFAGLAGELARPQDEFQIIVENGLLEDAITTASTIVRLLNDMGLALTLPAGGRVSLIHKLWKYYEIHSGRVNTFSELLMRAGQQINALTRLRKDIYHGEFNICLQNLVFSDSVDYGIAQFDENLAYYSKVYRQSQMHLHQVLTMIDTQMRNSVVSQVIRRFVGFHEKIYANHYDTSMGEYVA
ncbi:MAG: hypothetical protein J0L63_17585 [Anaerolineae bacterium]|nr:hypothetical protein [Anaerolineae bacterium]MBN8620731.1 hypothetical protein [Anaerolineae bacterium]